MEETIQTTLSIKNVSLRQGKENHVLKQAGFCTRAKFNPSLGWTWAGLPHLGQTSRALT